MNGCSFAYLGSASAGISGEGSTIILGDAPDSVDMGNVVVVEAYFQLPRVDDSSVLNNVASDGGEAGQIAGVCPQASSLCLVHFQQANGKKQT